MRRRRPGVTTAPTTAALATGERPGDTAAPTTAALATGEGPGLTAAVTTAALATGAPMTPTPRRPGPSGISHSCCFERGVRVVGLVGLDGGDDRLDRDPAVGDELPAGATHRRSERRGPQVLVDQHAGDRTRLHRSGEMDDILFGEGLGELVLEALDLFGPGHVRQLMSVDRAVLGLLEDEDVHDPDDAGVVEPDQLFSTLAREILSAGGEFDDQI